MRSTIGAKMIYNYCEYIAMQLKKIEDDFLSEFGISVKIKFNSKDNYFLAMKDSVTFFKIILTSYSIDFLNISEIKEFQVRLNHYSKDIDIERLLLIFQKNLFRK